MRSGLFLALLGLAGQTIVAQDQDHWHFRVDHARQLVTLDSEVPACVEVKNGSAANGNSFVLGDCSKYDHGIEPVSIGGEEDAIVMFRTRLDPTKCMQATHGGKVRKGAWMRVYPCDPDNRLQRFDFADIIQLEGTNWCAAYCGNRPSINQDHIKIRSCNDPPVYKYSWD